MKRFTRKGLCTAIGLAGAAFVLPAHAGFSWTIDSYPAQGSCGAAVVGNACTRSDTDAGTTVNMTATGWASSVAGDVNSDLEQATLKRYDGLGVNAQGESTGQPQHAADNNGKLESILYSFTSGGNPVDVIIDSVTQGWHMDADFSLVAYTGNGAPDFNNLSYADMNTVGNGWTLVSNNTYTEGADSTSTDITASDDANNDYNSSNLNLGNVSSSYWLVAVLNGAFSTGGVTLGNDYIKVKTLTASLGPQSQTAVPAPSTAGLLLVALGALLANRRKFQGAGTKA